MADLQTLWGRALLKKAIDVGPVKVFSAFLGTWRIMTCVRELAIGPYSNQLNPVHTHPPILSG